MSPSPGHGPESRPTGPEVTRSLWYFPRDPLSGSVAHGPRTRSVWGSWRSTGVSSDEGRDPETTERFPESRITPSFVPTHAGKASRIPLPISRTILHAHDLGTRRGQEPRPPRSLHRDRGVPDSDVPAATSGTHPSHGGPRRRRPRHPATTATGRPGREGSVIWGLSSFHLQSRGGPTYRPPGLPQSTRKVPGRGLRGSDVRGSPVPLFRRV